MSIPKIIHYCWLSDDPIPEQLQKCMDSWQSVLKGYEFMLWNFDRFDINSSIWVKQAFEAKKYAHAADYIRLYAVYNFGGIYLDMDIEAIKPFDELLNSDIMLAVENDEGRIEAGCFGAEKGHPFIKKCLDYYHNRAFKQVTLPVLMQRVKEQYFKRNNYNIRSSDYFTAKNIFTGLVNITQNTYAVHHYAGSWLSEEAKKTGKECWHFYEKYGQDKFLVSFVHRLENNSPDKIPLKKLFQIVIKRSIRKLLGKKFADWRRNMILKMKFDI